MVLFVFTSRGAREDHSPCPSIASEASDHGSTGSLSRPHQASEDGYGWAMAGGSSVLRTLYPNLGGTITSGIKMDAPVGISPASGSPKARRIAN
ncbi:hypothetical protein LA080_010731 [Diaporthe eres]|nr:hypothetical protein LA080_010731 [Diaporthe eres]